MPTPCPTCDRSTLAPIELEPGLPGLGCRDCEGTLLSLVGWRAWRDRTGAPAAADAAGGTGEIDDSASALRCPKCTRLMTKYRFAADASNQIDLCAHCDEVWLDRGEWELIERFALADKLAHVFTVPWQNRVRSEAAKKRAEDRWRETLGADYERARELRRWLASHDKGRELMAYLYLSQTEGV